MCDRAVWSPGSRLFGLAVLGVAMLTSACATPEAGPVASKSKSPLEDIYILRSVREQLPPAAGWCAQSRTGFAPFSDDDERFFSFWSVMSRPEDGMVVDARHTRIAELRACFGPTEERTRQKFYAEVRMAEISFRGSGECLALTTDFPEAGLFAVRCQLLLSGAPRPFIGGILTTNTLISRAPFGGETEPPGYAQASIATIRLWRAGSSR